MYKYILIIASLFLFSACSINKPAVAEFRINTNLILSDENAQMCLDKSIKVAQAFSSNSIMSIKMNYAQGPNKQFVYSQSQWADAPNRAITSEVERLLKESKFFKSVQTSKSRSNNDLILEISIEDFMQYFNAESTESYAIVALSMSLLDATTNSVVASNSFKSRVQVKQLDAEGGVEALNSALEELLAQTYHWFVGVCK